jgi:transposase
MGIPISAGMFNNFNKDAFDRLEFFEAWVKEHLVLSPLVHADETGINVIKRGKYYFASYP